MLVSDINKDQAQLIFEEHSPYVYRVALWMTKSKTLADDITQETFIRVFKNYNIYDPSKPIRPWIYKIATNITRNMLRKQKWVLFGSAPSENHAQVEAVDIDVLRAEERLSLIHEIDKLSFKSKEVIVLHFYAGLKMNEISIVLGIPLGTCKSRLNTGLNKLRRNLPKNPLFKDVQRRELKRGQS